MRISVIIPIYNAEKYLHRCLESIMGQTYEDYEVILINDGSTDDSYEICKLFSKRYENIRLFNKENGGSASARNLGLSEAKGKYIVFLDSDDYVEPTYLDHMVQLAVNHNADIVQCDFQVIDEKSNYTKVDRKISIQHKTNIEMLEDFCTREHYLRTVVLWNKLFKREVIGTLRFVEGKSIDDEYLIYQLLYHAKKCIITNEILYYYFMSKDSQMRSAYSLKRLDNIEATEEQLDFFKKISNEKLYNRLLYRYYMYLNYNAYAIKKYHRSETKILMDLNYKKKGFYKALLVTEIPFKDKMILLMRYIWPKSYEYI